MTVINGVVIDSNKQISSIVNTRVNFTDGSWCDVTTGQVVNKGGGYINIGGGQMENGIQDIEVFGPRTYLANALEIQSVSAEVDIQPINGNDMTVTIKGQKSSIENISVENIGGTLTIKSKENNRRKGGISISGNCVSIGGSVSGIVMRGNNIFVGNGGNEADVKISIGVPKGSSVSISGIDGNVNIGDTLGSFVANVLGGNDVKAGCVGSATISVQGSGDVDVKSVKDSLAISIQGSGDVVVRGGSVQSLNINVMGSGDARFKGKAISANLSVMGSGDVDVNYVENRPVKNIMGSGDINVGNW